MNIVRFKKYRQSFLCLIFWFLFFSTGMAQQVIDIEDRLAWKPNKALPKDFTVALSPSLKINTLHVSKKVPSIFLFVSRPHQHVVRLTLGDTVLLVGIPYFSLSHSGLSRIYSARYALTDEKIMFYQLEISDIHSGVLFPETVKRQTISEVLNSPFFRSLEPTIYATEPEELHINLYGGDFGDATLIYTAQSATPEIIYR